MVSLTLTTDFVHRFLFRHCPENLPARPFPSVLSVRKSPLQDPQIPHKGSRGVRLVRFGQRLVSFFGVDVFDEECAELLELLADG